jgi:hypothetical protein
MPPKNRSNNCQSSQNACEALSYTVAEVFMNSHFTPLRSSNGTGGIGFLGHGWVFLAIGLVFRFAGTTLSLRDVVDHARDVLAASPPRSLVWERRSLVRGTLMEVLYAAHAAAV